MSLLTKNLIQKAISRKTLAGTILPFFIRIGDRPSLLAIRHGLTQVLPLVMIGAIALLFLNIPFPQPIEFIDRISSGHGREICLIIQNGSFGIAALAILISICYSYVVQWTRFYDPFHTNHLIATLSCFSAYFILVLPLDGKIDTTSFSFHGGLPIALFVGLSCPPLFLILSRINPFRRYLFSASCDSYICEAISAFPVALIISLLYACIRVFFWNEGMPSMVDTARSIFLVPFEDSTSDCVTGLKYIGFSQFLWFFGIHGPNLLSSLEGSLFDPALHANIEAVQHGLSGVNILTKPFIDVYSNMGGSGSTLALLLAIFFRSKEKSYRRLACIALFPALFNVNEVILFGLPIVFNPVYFIPFLLAPLMQYCLAYLVTAAGLVPIITHNIHWTSPILLSGYMATGSVAGAILQVFCLCTGVLIYLPFVKLANSVHFSAIKRNLEKLAEAAEAPASMVQQTRCIHLPGQIGHFAKTLALELDRALRKGDQLYLVYQPQIDISNQRVIGSEALLRWKHPVYGFIPPYIAVALAEDTGLMDKLGQFILQKACMEQAEIVKKIPDFPPHLSVNFAAQQIADEKFLQNITSVLYSTGVPPEMLKVEVTETVALSPVAGIINSLHKLREMGVRVAIDDFGMGHTSIRYLKEFPVDYIKIDRSLTKDFTNSANDQILQSITQLCEGMKIQIIVEGVETEPQLKRFKEYHCSIYQGFYFSKPLAPDDYLAYIQNFRLS